MARSKEVRIHEVMELLSATNRRTARLTTGYSTLLMVIDWSLGTYAAVTAGLHSHPVKYVQTHRFMYPHYPTVDS